MKRVNKKALYNEIWGTKEEWKKQKIDCGVIHKLMFIVFRLNFTNFVQKTWRKLQYGLSHSFLGTRNGAGIFKIQSMCIKYLRVGKSGNLSCNIAFALQDWSFLRFLTETECSTSRNGRNVKIFKQIL